MQALYRHTRSAHGDWAEYRKHLFWFAQKRGFLPLLPWQKRHILANLSFFQCFSTPESGAIEWSEAASIQTAVQRQEMGCAICARKDWLENRYRVYLWREPDSATSGEELHPEMVLQNHSLQEQLGDDASKHIQLEMGRDKLNLRTMNDGCFCLGNAEAVNKLQKA